MTDEMLALAEQNTAKLGISNVEFQKGVMEAMPVADASVDVIISNCVINLSPGKDAVFAEAFRVLRPTAEGCRSQMSFCCAIWAPTQQDHHALRDGCIAVDLDPSDYVRRLT